MQDDVKAVERELTKIADACRREDGTDIPLGESLRKACSTLATLQERCERLETAARAALPWVTSEERWSALAEALGIDTRDKCIHGTGLEDDCDQCAAITPDSSGAYSMSPEDTDPKLDRG